MEQRVSMLSIRYAAEEKVQWTIARRDAEANERARRIALENCRRCIRRMISDINEKMGGTIVVLSRLEKEVAECAEKCKISNVVGTVSSIVGGIVFAVGAISSIPTFGATAPLMAVGGTLTLAGAGTNIGAIVARHVVNSDARKKALAQLVELEKTYRCFVDQFKKLEDFARLCCSPVYRAIATGPRTEEFAKVLSISTVIDDTHSLMSYLGERAEATPNELFRMIGDAKAELDRSRSALNGEILRRINNM